ncbi:sulfotransferase [Gilvibacter sp.]|uniref:sulfotransferase family protein n=1 Tax=Gilvibacter sp. TaxID=2729997 RepID=UPI0025BC322D|nr:sulfotransferase [Gilvibacter sp.]NQX77806.1 sulfotransferase [Gilvibacter sp.]
MKVNAFVIGVQKAGTTSIYEWLIQHPQVCGEIFLKDYPFFIEAELFQQGPAVLEQRFNCSNEPIRISGCVDYIENPEALKRIAEYNPEAKMILLLREPVSRIRSAYKFLSQLAKEDSADINEALSKDAEYMDRSLYAEKVAKLYSIFPEKNIKLIVFERLAKEPDAVLEELFSFLNIEQGHPIETFVANPTANARFKSVNKVLFDKEKNKGFRAVVKALVPPALRLKIVRFIKDSNTKSAAVNTTNDLNEQYLKQLESDKAELKKYIDFEAYW